METMTPSPIRGTLEDYFRLERSSKEKHEFRDGKILAMAGGTAEHSLISANLIGELRSRLKGGRCKVFDSNLRVQIARTVLYTYPDAMVVCGELQFDGKDANRTTVTNPKVVFEILSPSTEAYDRGDKFSQYLRLDSLQEYVLVSQTSPRIEIYARREDGTWLFSHFNDIKIAAKLGSLGIELPLSEIYSGIEFPPVPELGPEGKLI